MNKKYSLVLTDNFENINLKENILLIKHQDYLKKNFNAEVINYPQISRDELYHNYDKCEKIFNSLMQELTSMLNYVHGVNYSFRAWDIMLGKWLRDFILICEKYFRIIDHTLKNYSIEKIYSIDSSSYNFAINNTRSFPAALGNGEWFFCFCADLLSYLKPKSKIIKTLPKERSFTNSNYSNETSKKKINFNQIVYSLLGSTLNFFKLNNYALIKDTYLPLPFEKNLELKLYQVPQLWSEIEINYQDKKNTPRPKIKLKTHSSHEYLERYIRENLGKYIPKFIVENFNDIKKIADSKKFPKKPKFIFTSVSYVFDEVFKFYAASKVEQKIPLYIGQHGNNEFSKIHHVYTSHWNFSDKFISWGAKKEPKIKSAFNFKTTNKNKGFFDANGKLLIIFDEIGDLPSDLYKNDFKQFDKIQMSLNLINSLNKDIKKNTILRFNDSYFINYFGTQYIDFFKDLEIEIDKGEKDINKLSGQSRLSIFNYDSTGILENYVYNRPTLFIVAKDFLNCLTKEIEQKYQMLLENNLMFVDEKKLIKHINHHWANILEWWMSEKNQRIIKEFNKDFNISPNKKSIKKLKELLL